MDRRRPPCFSRCARWLAMTLLATSPVAAVTTTATASPGPAPVTVSVAESTARSSLAVGGLRYADGAGTRRWGLRKHAAWSTRVIKPTFRVRSVHGFRASNSSDHGRRLAADFMVGHAKGDRVARFSRRHHRQLNVSYVIWNQRIWSVERAREGWRRMADAGSATANHKDHVHVSYRRIPRNSTFRR
jgi:hypothetical protein